MTEEYAKLNFASICEAFDRMGQKYTINGLSALWEIPLFLGMKIGITIGIVGDVCEAVCRYSFFAPPDKKIEGAQIVNAMNRKIVDGVFLIDLSSGEFYLRIAESLRRYPVTPNDVLRMIDRAISTTNLFHDKLQSYCEGRLGFTVLMKELCG